MSHVYCQECGFQNSEAAKFCARCGTALLIDEAGGDPTLSLTPEEVEEGAAALGDVGIEGPALVVRSGGGRSGEHFELDRPETTVGRSPDCEIFLDDVTVSRRHAVLRKTDGGYTVEDLGSLNGTFVNRKRVESAQLGDGDELQIGKYRMTFFAAHEHH